MNKFFFITSKTLENNILFHYLKNTGLENNLFKCNTRHGKQISFHVFVISKTLH